MLYRDSLGVSVFPCSLVRTSQKSLNWVELELSYPFPTVTSPEPPGNRSRVIARRGGIGHPGQPDSAPFAPVSNCHAWSSGFGV